jgi:thiol-disulfide isomerase/thioredoxin
MMHIPSSTCLVAAMFAATCSLAPAAAQDPSPTAEAARQQLSDRSGQQQRFLFEHRKARPIAGASDEARYRWLVEAETAYAEQVGAEVPPDSRIASFSPYVWSWSPMLVADGEPSAALTERTHLERVLPALLADLEAAVAGREAGASALLHYPSFVNGVARCQLLERVPAEQLQRLQAAIGRLPDAVAAWQRQADAEGRSLSRRVPAIVALLRRFSRLVDVERGIRDGRLHRAHAELSSLAIPGDPPSGFASLVARLARAHAAAERPDAALAVLDLGLLSTTEGSLPAAALRPLYTSCGGRAGARRFELAVARRPAPLLPSALRFDPATLVDVATGRPLDVATLRGRPLLLDFVQRHCGPCQAAVPKLQAFQRQHPEVAVLAIVAGPAADRRPTLAAVRERGGTYPVVHATVDWQQRFGVTGFPSYVVVAADGVVLQAFGMRGGPVCSFDDVVATFAKD